MGCSWSAAGAWAGHNCPQHRTWSPRLWSNLPGALTRCPCHGVRSWATLSSRPRMGTCLHSSLPGHRSSPGPLVSTGSGIAVSQAPPKPPGPWRGQPSWWSWWAFNQPSWPDTLGSDSNGSGPGKPRRWWRSGTQGVCRPQVLTCGRSAPGSHSLMTCTRAACSPGAVLCAALCAWHAGLLRVGLKWHPEWSDRDWETVLLVHLLLLGEDVSLARAFLGSGVHDRVLAALLGMSCTLSGRGSRLHTHCLHEVS